MTRLGNLAIRAAVTTTAFGLCGLFGGVAHAQAPSAGDPCAVLHATVKDDNGRTMWCNPTTTGNHSLVWQYGAPG